MGDLAASIAEFSSLFGAYGIPILVVLVIIDGSIMAITSGVLIATGSLPLSIALLIYSISDYAISTFYYYLGKGGNSGLLKVKNRLFPNKSKRGGKLKSTVEWLQASYKKHFYLTYLLFRFLPIPYTTLAANIASGGMIKTKRFYSYVAWLIPLQGHIYIAIGFLIAQGVLFQATPARMVGLIFALLVIVGVILLKPFINRWYHQLVTGSLK